MTYIISEELLNAALTLIGNGVSTLRAADTFQIITELRSLPKLEEQVEVPLDAALLSEAHDAV